MRWVDLSFQNWHKEFDKFWSEHLKVSKIFILMCSFWVFNRLVVSKLAKGTSQISTRTLESLKNLCFNWLLVNKVYIVWATKVQESYLSWLWRIMQILKKKTDLWFEKRLDKFGKFSPEHLKVSKLGLWWDPFVQNRKGMILKFT